MPGSLARPAAFGIALLVGAVAATTPAAAATPAPTPTPTPCPGTVWTPPTPTPGASPTTTTPQRPTAYPPPVIAQRSPVIGGERLGTNTLVTDLAAGTPAPPTLNATSWVLADAGTGEVLAAKAPHAALRPASTLKALTALELLPRLDPAAVVTATDEDMAADGTKVGIVTGNRYTVGNLFSAMLMASANDAVYALARTAPGGRAGTVTAVNALARHLGALDTVVKDPSGLDADGQVSSAYDLALVGRAALADKRFRAYSTTREITFPGAKKADGTVVAPYQVQNHNKLLYNYPGAVGVKNGFTTLAHGTYIAAATRGAKTYLLSFMCADGITWHEMAATLDWAFAHGAKARPVGELVAPGSATSTATSAATTAADTGTTTSSEPAPSGTSHATTPAKGPEGIVERWWGASVLAALLLFAGVVGTRRLDRRGRRSTGR